MTQITKVGHFYMAQLGHYHVAATIYVKSLTNYFRYAMLFLEWKGGMKQREVP